MKEKTIYMGGEKDSQDVVMPNYFSKFFTLRMLGFVLIIMVVMLLLLLPMLQSLE